MSSFTTGLCMWNLISPIKYNLHKFYLIIGTPNIMTASGITNHGS